MAATMTDAMVRSLRKVAFVDQFEPFPQAIISDTTLRRLVEAGLVETGRSCRPAVGDVGFRLTSQGWNIAHECWTGRNPKLSS